MRKELGETQRGLSQIQVAISSGIVQVHNSRTVKLILRSPIHKKEEKMTQNDLGKAVGTSGDIIGKYERNEIKPSIYKAAKIAEALGVTIDYLVKEGEYQNIDNETLKRLKELEKLSSEDKSHVFAMLDAFFAKNKLKTLLA